MIFSKDGVLSFFVCARGRASSSTFFLNAFFSYKKYRTKNIYKTNVLLYDIENKGEERWRTEQREREERQMGRKVRSAMYGKRKRPVALWRLI